MRGPPVARGAPGLILLLATGLSVLGTTPVQAQTPRPTCESCHGELEFLRQHVATLPEAQVLLVPAGVVASSAHASLTCTDCHDGFLRFPHRAPTTPRSCASCHEETSAKWREGVHSLDDGAPCSACHGVHNVLSVESLRAPEGIAAMRAACASCHYEPQLPVTDPHHEGVACAGCHEPHATFPSQDDRASTHPVNQAATCGACHEEAAAGWSGDSHARAVPLLAIPGGQPLPGASQAAPPSCTACHGAHGMLYRASPGFPAAIMEQCSHCHEDYRESFADSYHGKATILGSERSATCSSCHGFHGVHPSSDPRSLVHEANLLATCQTCHPEATAGFALFQPHADHHDRERYPYVYWSYRLMTVLLLGTFAVFGAHTLLWVARLAIDAIRGTPPNAHHGHGGEG